MLAIVCQNQVPVPSIATNREKDFYRFMRRADKEELMAQREELINALDSNAARSLERVHSPVVTTMKDRLALINSALAIN